ncbi:hypothetical protein [Streptosporangium sp. NPDC003464]
MVWWPAFTLGAFNAVFFGSVLALWAAGMAVLLGSGRRWLSLKYSSYLDRYTGLEEFIATAGWLHRRFGARIHIYPWNPQTRRTASPYPYAHLNANPFGGAIGDLLRRQTARW